MATMPKIELKITSPDGITREEILTQDNAILGSGPSATVRLADPKVSSAHFMLKVGKNGDLTLLDLGSEAGTRLHGQAIKQPTALASGDMIQVGTTKVRVVFGESDATDVVPVVRDADATVEERTLGKEQDRIDTVRARALEAARQAEAKKAEAEAAPQPTRVEGKPTPPKPKSVPPPREGALSTFQGTTLALGPNANRLLNEEMSPEEAPTESDRELEVALLWGDTLIEVRTFPAAQAVKVGPAPTNDFAMYASALGESFELVGAGGAIHFPPGAKGLVRKDGREREASGEVHLGLGDRCLVTLDATHLVVRWIKPAKQLKSSIFDSVDFYFTKVLSVAFMLHLVLLIGFWITPLNNEMLSEDLFKNPSAFAKLIIQPPPKEKKKKFDLSGVKEGAKAKGKEGKFGKKEAKKEEAAPSKKGSPIVNAHKREEDRTKIMKAGLLGALGGADGAASNIFGPGGLGTGINNALGGLKGGAGMGDAHGVGGLGSRGTGPGGGGTALGLGGLGNKGTGHGAGGNGLLDLGGRGKGDTRIVPGRVNVQGSLSKEIIGKIIRRHWNEIKYCYETELNKNPNLYGKVAVAFTIDGTGSVSDANVSESTMGNSNVENCMIVRVKRWRFPEPKGGGSVFVTYPWVFKAAGDDE
ncbi:MAG TPA: TonB family protein [Myxococcales bacterium]|nr:TonB family protein [Myxococcales bacterium]